jgi:glycosyltransferase involved in cell wall biosynthesis
MTNLVYIGNKLSDKGKTESTIDTLSTYLSVEGYTVYIASSKKNKLLRLIDMLFTIVKYSKKTSYVLIDTYSTSNFYYAYICSQLCRIFKLKYIPILHGGNLPNRLKNNPKLSKAIFKNAYKNVAPSLYLKSHFEAYEYQNIIHIPNNIELEKYHFKARTFETINLLWVRSFSEIYNPLLAIDVLKILKENNLKATLCMVGPEKDGSLQKAKQYAEKLNLEVKFTGKLSKEAWIKLSEDYNIFINTTNFDNMPVSIIEAMALGLPIVSTNVGGIPYLIENEKEGLLVKQNDISVFLDAIKILMNNIESTTEMALNARKKVEDYNWHIVKNLWISMLQ